MAGPIYSVLFDAERVELEVASAAHPMSVGSTMRRVG